MDTIELRRLFEEVADGRLSPAEASHHAETASGHLGFARIDHGRDERCGFPEVIWCPGKTTDQVVTLAGAILERSGRVLMTRADPELADAVIQALGNLARAQERDMPQDVLDQLRLQVIEAAGPDGDHLAQAA